MLLNLSYVVCRELRNNRDTPLVLNSDLGPLLMSLRDLWVLLSHLSASVYMLCEQLNVSVFLCVVQMFGVCVCCVWYGRDVCVCARMCAYISMYACTLCACVSMFLCVHVTMCTCMYECMFLCTWATFNFLLCLEGDWRQQLCVTVTSYGFLKFCQNFLHFHLAL